jgi:hypothetical protein
MATLFFSSGSVRMWKSSSTAAAVEVGSGGGVGMGEEPVGGAAELQRGAGR